MQRAYGRARLCEGGGDNKANGFRVKASGEERTAVNSDSWPSSSGSSILMLVLRAEREEGWLILGYVSPPPSTAWLTQQS